MSSAQWEETETLLTALQCTVLGCAVHELHANPFGNKMLLHESRSALTVSVLCPGTTAQ